MKNSLFLTLLLLASHACFGQPILAWGDQGDGTYRNPVLNANYPDSDVERCGDKWYMISSTSMFAPGMTILESRDLVNWSLVGHVFDRVSWRDDYAPAVMGTRRGGVWAGDLAFHNGEWLCYVVDPEAGLFVSAARDIAGPWSEPRLMQRAVNWTDPSVFFDEQTRKAYLLCHTATDAATREYENRIFELSWDGRRLLDSGRVFYRGRMAEAAKMYKRGGYYYVFISQWVKSGRENDRKQLVLRARNPYGPYESRVVLERGNGCTRSCCQGALVQAPDSSWWYLHQLVQSKDSYEGRPQFLIPVRWEEGWPVLGEDPDGNGVGNTVWAWRKPVAGMPVGKPQGSDDFGRPELAPQWAWYCNPDDTKWSLTERRGFLRMRPVRQVVEGEFLKTPNILSQRKMGRGTDTVTVKLSLAGLSEGTHAGLTLFAGDYQNLGVVVGPTGAALCTEHNGVRTFVGEYAREEILLRAVIQGGRCLFQYSPDGETFTALDGSYTLRPKGFMAQRIGVYCYNNRSDEGFLDVDWFEYDYR